MARFYATIKGNRGEASRMGTKDSGMQGHIRGWNLGARVIMSVDEDGKDICTVTLTSGSGYSGKVKHLGEFKESDLKNGS